MAQEINSIIDTIQISETFYNIFNVFGCMCMWVCVYVCVSVCVCARIIYLLKSTLL